MSEFQFFSVKPYYFYQFHWFAYILRFIDQKHLDCTYYLRNRNTFKKQKNLHSHKIYISVLFFAPISVLQNLTDFSNFLIPYLKIEFSDEGKYGYRKYYKGPILRDQIQKKQPTLPNFDENPTKNITFLEIVFPRPFPLIT